MDPLSTDRDFSFSLASLPEGADAVFDATLHRLSRWAGYLILFAVYLGVAYFLLHLKLGW